MKKEFYIKDSSSVDKLAGESEKVDDFKDYLEFAFNNQKVEPWEKRKTEEDETVISSVLKEMPAFLEKYGGKMPPLTLDHFHAVDTAKEGSPRLKGDAGFQSKYQRIIYSPEAFGLEPRLSKAQTMAHEVLHFSSYQYFKEEETDSGSGVRFKRSGLYVSKDGDGDLLEEVSGKIDEAVMDELSIRFIKEYLSKEPWFLEDLPPIDSAGGTDSLHELKQDESGNLYFKPHSHAREIKALNTLIKHINSKMPEVYKTEEDVFDLFAKAALTNNLLPLVRALRKSMGKYWLAVVEVSFISKK
jgi:hypothetical protein